MKKIITALFLACLSMASCREDDISGIEKRCSDINAHLGSYKHKTIDLTGITTQGGSITGYYKDDKLVMASTASFDQSGRTTAEYFFDDDKLECVLQEEFTYNHPMYYTDEMAREDGDTAEAGGYDDKKTVMKVSRYYFYNNSMVKWYNQDNRLIPETDRKYQFQSALMLSDAENLKKMLQQ